jgi:hypothetical protein
VTDYDAIAHAYRETKRLPIKQHSEGFTLFQVLGSVRGLAVLDAACGDGYYTRARRMLGRAWSHVWRISPSVESITVDTHRPLIPGTNRAAVDRLKDVSRRNPGATSVAGTLRIVKSRRV